MSHGGQPSCLYYPVAYHSHSLTPRSHTPVNETSQPQRTLSQESTFEGIRRRVCKACERCRLKKSKCDGSNPCTTCKTIDAICVFGERKRSRDKVYPTAYVEMLEQQQGQLVSGLAELYDRLRKAEAWIGPPLEEHDGKPYTHHILAALGLLKTKDGSRVEFEEHTEKLQQKLIADRTSMTQHTRRGSLSSESEHSQHSDARSRSRGTPTSSKSPSLFKEDYKFTANSELPSPPAYSPALHSQRFSFQQPAQPSPLQQSFPLGDASNVFHPERQHYPPANENKFNNMNVMRPDFANQASSLQQPMGSNGLPNSFQQRDMQGASFDMLAESFAGYPDPTLGAYQLFYSAEMQQVPGFMFNEMEVDFGNFVSVHT